MSHVHVKCGLIKIHRLEYSNYLKVDPSLCEDRGVGSLTFSTCRNIGMSGNTFMSMLYENNRSGFCNAIILWVNNGTLTIRQQTLRGEHKDLSVISVRMR